MSTAKRLVRVTVYFTSPEAMPEILRGSQSLPCYVTHFPQGPGDVYCFETMEGKRFDVNPVSSAFVGVVHHEN
jgi:hypothetical protein